MRRIAHKEANPRQLAGCAGRGATQGAVATAALLRNGLGVRVQHGIELSDLRRANPVTRATFMNTQ